MQTKLKTKSLFKSLVLLSLLVISFVIAFVPSFISSTKAATDIDWTVVAEARSVKAYPDLREYVWQKTASMAPNGPYDRIGLHRLVKTNAPLRGVLFMLPATYSSGEQLISNPPTDNFTLTENNSEAIYWANRNFDVYAIDYRTHFVPATLNASQLSFMANWGYDQWISDIKEAISKAKAVSVATKVFLVGMGTNTHVALCYATLYGKYDLRGLILLGSDLYATPNAGVRIVSPAVTKRGNETNTYNLTSAIASLKAGNYTFDLPNAATTVPLMNYALANPGAPAVNPFTNATLSPAINPATNNSWTNITEWASNVFYTAYGPGALSNTKGGYGDITMDVRYWATEDLHWPTRIYLENAAMADWTNCPYLTYDFDDHWSEIDIPLLAFASQYYSNQTAAFRFVNGINNLDFTGIMLQKYGQYDVYFGPFSARDVSQPTLDWMLNSYRPPTASAFCDVTVMTGQTWYFFAHSGGSQAPITYQWYEGTTILNGQTSMVLPITKTTAGKYTYFCRVTDSEGASANSNTVTLTVINK